MTPANLILALQERIKELVKGYFYDNDGVMLPVKVYAGWAPARTEDCEDILPCVCILPRRIDDVIANNQQNGGTCTVSILVGVKEEMDADNWLAIVNLIEHIRQGLLLERTLARKFYLTGNLTTDFDEIQARPLYYAGITAQYTIAQPIPNRQERSY